LNGRCCATDSPLVIHLRKKRLAPAVAGKSIVDRNPLQCHEAQDALLPQVRSSGNAHCTSSGWHSFE
jgi:hypothetical protein